PRGCQARVRHLRVLGEVACAHACAATSDLPGSIEGSESGGGVSPSPDRRATILQCSAELFATRGVGATTVREIGVAAGVFSGSLYHYFPSKNAIVAELLGGFMSDIERRFDAIAASSAPPGERVRAMIDATLAVIDQHPYPTAIYQNDRNYLRDKGLLEPVDRASLGIREHWLTAIRQGVAEGYFRADIAPEIFY